MHCYSRWFFIYAPNPSTFPSPPHSGFGAWLMFVLSSGLQGTMKRHPLPPFGYWDYCDELLSAHYFESAVQAGVIRGHYFGEDGDLFYHGKVSDTKLQTTPRRPRALKAVDEDLYKIPPELLYQKPKRVSPPPVSSTCTSIHTTTVQFLVCRCDRLQKRSLRKLWSGCMGINSVA
ncbi:hypothetical protein B296_00021814 [Ensete ventricosum]|uniref:Uncharacterized protein n=1 Tax=Ensete ventricosum TaxID=4639 RepID=A0A426Y2V4_ENSVE|nr:hypothetical protein B296_00021814 [Ensete ventricosum]